MMHKMIPSLLLLAAGPATIDARADLAKAEAAYEDGPIATARFGLLTLGTDLRSTEAMLDRLPRDERKKYVTLYGPEQLLNTIRYFEPLAGRSPEVVEQQIIRRFGLPDNRTTRATGQIDLSWSRIRDFERTSHALEKDCERVTGRPRPGQRAPVVWPYNNWARLGSEAVLRACPGQYPGFLLALRLRMAPQMHLSIRPNDDTIHWSVTYLWPSTRAGRLRRIAGG
ncbi:MAG: hypothetical protein KKC79_16720 [Gammaproteobacteria bacterium]|nr:hypothetical protein [Gammaproteobacteria bacterium]